MQHDHIFNYVEWKTIKVLLYNLYKLENVESLQKCIEKVVGLGLEGGLVEVLKGYEEMGVMDVFTVMWFWFDRYYMCQNLTNCPSGKLIMSQCPQ